MLSPSKHVARVSALPELVEGIVLRFASTSSAGGYAAACFDGLSMTGRGGGAL